MIPEYQHRRDIVCEELAKIPGAVFTNRPAPSTSCPICRSTTDREFAAVDADRLLAGQGYHHGGPGRRFYATPGKGKHEVRIAYVLKEGDLRKALQILAKGIEAYNRKK